jgi:hypothetical protein
MIAFVSLFWIVWTPLTCFTTWMTFHSGSWLFFAVFSLFGSMFVIGIPFGCLQLLWTEWIEVSPDSVSWTVNGFFRPKPKHAPISSVIELSLGRVRSQEAREVSETLNLFLKGGVFGMAKRRELAAWLALEHKTSIFEGIQRYVTRHSIPLKMIAHPDEYLAPVEERS